jgi:ribonuclease E
MALAIHSSSLCARLPQLRILAAPGDIIMTTRMLIDARHPEETRVAVLKGNRIEEFDFESADRKQIKGNIYLAKVTRVEPSLQAAFVDFGGNRHGFLAFSEIHPDYYQIPKEDREALLAEEAAHAAEEAALRAAEEESEDQEDDFHDDEGLAHDLVGQEDGIEEIDTSEKDDVAIIEDGQVNDGDSDGETGSEDDETGAARRRGRRRQGGRARSKQADELRAKRIALRRRYKIQDVIQRRQVLLVQVVKEERGNKGAALTTYLSLAGRYCVLMPNSSHGGGISRKISSASDRKRLKQIISELSLPKSMGCIIRTAGLQRTKTEIKRDFDYLARLWDEIREKTLRSTAPMMIHSDSDLIKRAIRDIYNRDIEEVVVEGDEGYRAAKEFMKLLMPSHARRVKQYADPVPLFQRHGAEDQLSAMYDPVVQLKSGGYLVINPTEALVSIDINSGRSTKEHGIEQTALATNLEAAKEIARQLRLRDMAGLVVIDFIDMEYGSNIRKVEKAMKDALKHDRARIQVGRISGFGLMEMSRQRLRTGVLEATTRSCPHCDGTGLVRTASSAGLSALRLIEDEAAKGKGTIISLYASTEAAIYLLNAKRADLAEIEDRYGVSVEVIPEGENEGAKMRVLSSGPRPATPPQFAPLVEEIEEEEEDEDFVEQDDEIEEDEEGEPRKKRRRRRRGGRGRKRFDQEEAEGDEATNEEDAPQEDASEEEVSAEAEDDDEGQARKRRRRGGRRRRGRRDDNQDASEDTADETSSDLLENAEEVTIAPMEASEPEAAKEAEAEAVTEEQPKKRTRRRTKKAVETEAEGQAETAETLATEETPAPSPASPVAETEAVAIEEAPAKPKRARRKKADASVETTGDATQAGEETPPTKPKRTRRKKADVATEEAVSPVLSEETPAAALALDMETVEAEGDSSPRRGWWQRTFGN